MCIQLFFLSVSTSKLCQKVMVSANNYNEAVIGNEILSPKGPANNVHTICKEKHAKKSKPKTEVQVQERKKEVLPSKVLKGS